MTRCTATKRRKQICARWPNAATRSSIPRADFSPSVNAALGRLASEETLLQALETAISRTQSLSKTRVLITAGPTREAFDPVRFISNPSTGETGIALAREAALRGADVTLILGPITAAIASGSIAKRGANP